MQHDHVQSMDDMRSHAVEAMEMMAGHGRGDLDQDRQLELAVTRLLEIVGEAANRIGAEAQRAHPAIPWADIIAMRHRIAHGYEIVDLDIVWRVVRDELPELVAQLGAILD